jgi:hypothetical protein
MTGFCIGIIVGIVLGYFVACLLTSGAVEDAWTEGYHAGRKGGRNA